MTHSRFHTSNAGVTLVELLVALVVATLVSTMIFAGCLFSYKLYARWQVRSELLTAASLIQTMLEHRTSQADSVTIGFESSIVFHDHTKGPIALTIRNDSLFLGSEHISLDQASPQMVSISSEPSEGYINTSLLQWHIAVRKKDRILEWVGGKRTGMN